MQSKLVRKRMSRGMLAVAVLLGVLALLQLALWKKSNDRGSESKETQASDSNTLKGNPLLNRAQTEAEKKTYRRHWKEFIRAEAKDFRQTVLLGGIKDLVLRLKNTSPYRIDSARVKVSYIRSNGEVFQTEVMQFENIAAGSEKELYAPGSKKGSRVSCSIISLVSGEMNLCYNQNRAGVLPSNTEDPYRCR